MAAYSDEYAVAGSNFFPRATYKDEDDAAVTPSAASWSWYDEDGNAVNSREDVAISSPSTYNDITLTPADTALIDSDAASEKRYLVVSFTYTSSLGSGLTGIATYVIKIINPKSG